MVVNVHPMAGFLFGISGECSSHQTVGFWGSLQLVHYILNCRAFFGFSAANDYSIQWTSSQCPSTLGPFHHLSLPSLSRLLDMPGSDMTVPMVTTLVGVSWSTSTSSGVLKQAVTLAKPHGGVGGLTNANALAGRGDLGRDEALGDFSDGLKGMVLMGCRTLRFTCSAAVGGGTSPAAITGQDWM